MTRTSQSTESCDIWYINVTKDSVLSTITANTLYTPAKIFGSWSVVINIGVQSAMTMWDMKHINWGQNKEIIDIFHNWPVCCSLIRWQQWGIPASPWSCSHLLTSALVVQVPCPPDTPPAVMTGSLGPGSVVPAATCCVWWTLIGW